MSWREFYFRAVNFVLMMRKLSCSVPLNISDTMKKCDMFEIRLMEKLLGLKIITSAKLGFFNDGNIIHFDMNYNICEIKPSVLQWYCNNKVLPDNHAMRKLCEKNQFEKIKICLEAGVLLGVSAINSLISTCNISILDYLKQRSPKLIFEPANINLAYHTKDIKIIKWIIQNEGYPDTDTIRAIINDNNIKALRYLNELDPPVKFEQVIVDFTFTNNTTAEILKFFFEMKRFPSDVAIRKAIEWGLTKEILLLYRYTPQVYNINHLHIALRYGKTKLFKWLYDNIRDLELTDETANLAIEYKRGDLLKLILEK